jgi:hypothetical protein
LKKAVLFLALGAALAGAFLYGFVGRERKWFPYGILKSAYRQVRPEPTPAARTHRAVRAETSAARLAQREQVAALTQLPYLQGYHLASGRSGVLVYDEARAEEGWNLTVSAHASRALLLDMNGRAHHRWGIEASAIWPDLKVDGEKAEYRQYWRRAALLPGGDLLAIWEYIGMVRVDRSSRLKWAALNGAHHDVTVDEDGTIYVLTREERIVPEINPSVPILEDFVSILSADGRLLKRVSLLSAFAGSDYAAVLAGMGNSGDILHANGVRILDGRLAERAPAFRRGNLLISLRSLNTVAILDPAAEKIVWSLSGAWRAQHAPRMLANGRMLLFDNFAAMQVGASRVLEIDPLTQQIAWRYGEKSSERFYSESNGEAQRLANGNTVVVEADAGRAIEVTPAGETVWEYVNPFRVGEKKELQATLKQLERFPASLDVSWADYPDRNAVPREASAKP